MNKLFSALAFVLLITGCAGRQPDYVKLAVTTDVHGMIFPENMITGDSTDHSLAQVQTWVGHQRAARDTAFLLMDNGDFLQGQPSVYFFNTQRTDTPHLAARVMNTMQYDAATVGNHDIEAGPAVYDKLTGELNFPWLAANAVDEQTGEPYFEPYTVLQAGGRKIAVLGLITPGIPDWLPKNLWPGMVFEDMVITARKWVPVILREEQPDLLVGLFHAGIDHTYGGSDRDTPRNENATMLVAEEVPGFDIIFAGHDHRVYRDRVINREGDTVLVVDPGSHARYTGEVLADYSGNRAEPTLRARIIPMDTVAPSPGFLAQFASDRREVERYLADTVAVLTSSMHSRDGLFGPSSFVSLIHRVQMEYAEAQVSLTAPLAFNTTLEAGPLQVADLFKLYRYENMLYAMKLTGEEVDGFLEHAVAQWFHPMDDPADPLLLFETGQRGRLRNPYYNFSSAAGLEYVIHLDRSPGERVEILRHSDGTPFLPTDTLRVAVNSYRGNGGGGHLTAGAGIPGEELTNRIAYASDHDMRHLLKEWLGAHDPYTPDTLTNWHFSPAHWYRQAAERDRKRLFTR